MTTKADIALWRLYALRSGYLLMAVGLGLTIWPGIIHHDRPWTLAGGVVHCMLAAMGSLAVLGLRYPLAMLPLLIFELAWKTIWLLVVALPLVSAHTMDADTAETMNECLLVVVIAAVIPWDQAARNFVLTTGDRWR